MNLFLSLLLSAERQEAEPAGIKHAADGYSQQTQGGGVRGEMTNLATHGVPTIRVGGGGAWGGYTSLLVDC